MWLLKATFLLVTFMIIDIGVVVAHVQIQLSRSSPAAPVSSSRIERFGPYRRDEEDIRPIEVSRDYTAFYSMPVKVGTPGQTLSLLLRTDSWLTYLPSSNSTRCMDGFCADHGSFNQQLSSTFELTNVSFEQSGWWPNGSENVLLEGYNFHDRLDMSGIIVDNFTMGIGYELGEQMDGGYLSLAWTGPESDLPQDNLALKMVREGLIRTAAYSLYLNDQFSSPDAPSLLLGAIDTAKYEEPLITVDSFNTSEYGLMVQLTSLEATSPSGTDMIFENEEPLPMAVIIGTGGSWFPQQIAEEMWAIAGATWITGHVTPMIPCNLRDSAGSYRFRIGGPEGPLINVPLRQSIITSLQDSINLTNDGGEPLCPFMIINTTDPESYMLGENFMRAAYIVVDLYNHKISMAQARYNVSDSNIVPFVGHAAQAPSATPAGSQPTVTPTSLTGWTSSPAFTPRSTYSAAAGFASLTTAPSATSTPAPAPGGLSTGAKAGIGVGVPVGVVGIALLGFLFWRRRRSQRHPAYTPEPAPPPPPPPPVSELPPKESKTPYDRDKPVEMDGGGGGYKAAVNQRSPAELSPTGSGVYPDSMRISSPSTGYTYAHSDTGSETQYNGGGGPGVRNGRHLSEGNEYVAGLGVVQEDPDHARR